MLMCATVGVQLVLALSCASDHIVITDAVVYNATDVFDSATGRWSTAELSVARSGFAAVSVGTFAIFAGGANYFSCRISQLFAETIEEIAVGCYIMR
jgi:hypothetical protein